MKMQVKIQGKSGKIENVHEIVLFNRRIHCATVMINS